MFGWCNSLGLPAMASDPDKERSPPPPPTPLDFPIYALPAVSKTPSESALRTLQPALASIRRPQDISPEKFNALNLTVQCDVPVGSIVRFDGAESAVPPLPWETDSVPAVSLGGEEEEEEEEEEGDKNIFMDNGNAYPRKGKFEALLRELLLDNDDAFREVARLPPRAGREPVRVMLARKFWTALERMAQYWDSSMDEYFERPKTPEPGGGLQMQTDDVTQVGTTPMDMDEVSRVDQGQEQKQEVVKRYRGRRIAAGADMPEDVREEAIRALTEMAAWPFECQVSAPIIPPRLAVGTLLFPVRQTFEATRSPKDRQLARNRVLEGPVFVAQCRPETVFRGPEEVPGSGLGDTCDLVREVGSMLLAAQERAREGRTEVKPGEGKWWTMTPRWGGAPNDAVGDSEKVREEQEKQEKQASGNERKRSKYEHSLLGSRRLGLGRKLTNSEKWKLVQPGPSLWDRRRKYLQIGKPRDSPFDDIYMLSSINHHLAILHLRIHRRYLDILTTGESSFPADSTEPDHPWHVLKLRRTRWFDIFDAQDRLEVFKGIWTLFHYLLRRID